MLLEAEKKAEEKKRLEEEKKKKDARDNIIKGLKDNVKKLGLEKSALSEKIKL